MRLRRVWQAYILETEQEGIWETEVNVPRTLLEMEWRGVEIDVLYCRQAVHNIDERLTQIKAELILLTGQDFNPKSNKQKTAAMNAIGVYSPVKTGTGQQSWGKEALEVIEDPHPAIVLMREHEKLSSLKGTFFSVFIEAGVLHCNFKNWGTITGRCSCADPNLQNIPRAVQSVITEEDAVAAHQKALAKAIGDITGIEVTTVGQEYEADDFDEADPWMMAARRAFVPRDDYEFLCFDYSQMEMLVFLCYVNNGELLNYVEESYRAGKPFDYHTLVATEVWGGPEHPLFKEFRRWAKALNFGLIFGIGKKKLAKNLSRKQKGKEGDDDFMEGKTVTPEGAMEYKEDYFDRIHGSREFIERAKVTGETRGFIFNMFRRRYTIDFNRSYIGVNYLVQGSCADFMKQRMWLVRQALVKAGLDAHMILQVHDELILEVKKGLAEQVIALVKPILEERVVKIPRPVEVSRCEQSWISKEKVEVEKVVA